MDTQRPRECIRTAFYMLIVFNELGGATGVAPVRRGSEQRSASVGETSPSQKPKLFITGFRDREEENQYNVLCSRFGIQFGGLLSK